MVNGALLLNKNLDFKKHYFKTIKTFILICVFSFIVTLIKLPILKDVSFNSFITGVLKLRTGWSNHLWFLLSLAILYILFPLYKILFDKSKKLTIFLCLGLILLSSFRSIMLFISGIFPNENLYYGIHKIVSVYDKIFNYKKFDRILFSSAYFILGGIFAFYSSYIKKKLNTHKVVYNILLIVILVAFTYGNYIYGKTNKIGDMVWYGYPTIFTFVLTATLFIFCLVNCKENKYGHVVLFSNQCMGIYIFHFAILSYVNLFFSKVLSIMPPRNFITTTVTIIISFLISLAISKTKYLNKIIKL